ncbi:MAG TPA: hypothetical protein VFV99_06475 [Kofleriaceae bacterium]|nr:hypothetical protein [Kofleriaceae bacterium]
MKVWLLAALLVVSTAHADTFELRDVPSTTNRPPFVTRTRDCNPNGVSQMRTLTATIGGYEVELHRDCMAAPQMSSLTVRIHEDWFVAEGFTLTDFGGNMSDSRIEIHRVSESLVKGTFADGSPAIVYRAVTRTDFVSSCDGDDCVDPVTESVKHDNFLVCSVAMETVRCGRIEYECPATGCGAPAFVLGQLVAIEQRTYVPARRN